MELKLVGLSLELKICIPVAAALKVPNLDNFCTVR